MAMRPSSRGSCFVMMPFAKEFEGTFTNAIQPAAEACSLECVRADTIREPGPIIGQIYDGIEGATVCVADLTGGNPNVLAEFGYAQAKRKSVVLINRGDPLDIRDLPFDVRHLRVIPYLSTDEGHRALREDLRESIRSALGSDKRVLKEMLVPDNLNPSGESEERFVVAASPLSWREAAREGGGFEELQPTSSDHVGIRGLIQAFGLIYGLGRLPDLVNPGDYTDDVARHPAHLYCIGSPKANRWTGVLLREFFQQWKPRLEFKADPESDDLRNVRVMVHVDDRPFAPPGFLDEGRYVRDFGFVIRGPHPVEPEYMVMILAGRSALGTHAACLAATDPRFVARVKDRLPRPPLFNLNDYRNAFWAVVQMEASNYTADQETLDVPWAGPFQPRRAS